MKKNLIRFSVRGRKLGYLIIAALVVVAICGFFIVRAFTNNKSVDCTEIASEVKSTTSQPSFGNVQEGYEKYKAIKGNVDSCKQGSTSSAKNKLDLLVFNYDAAVSAYSYGDTDKAKEYAEKALEFNKQVDDGSRNNRVVDANTVSSQMESIKNGTY